VVQFEVLSDIRDVETIASGTGVRDRRRLNRDWYEAHGIGKKELKFKKPLDVR
jgi:hypothetical protein